MDLEYQYIKSTFNGLPSLFIHASLATDNREHSLHLLNLVFGPILLLERLPDL